MSRLSIATVLSLFALVTAGCGGDGDDTADDPAANTGGGGGGGDCADGSMTADIDGTAWDASLAVCAVNESGIFNLTGSDSAGQQLAVTVNGPSVGDHTLDGMQNTGRWNEGTSTFMVMMGGTPGDVTFDGFDDSGASGTFSFEAVDVQTQETRVISNGAFDVSF